MKFRLLVLLALSSTAVGATPSRYQYEVGIYKIIEKCKAGDVYSLPIPFPALNNLRISSMTSRRSDFSVSLSDITIDGIQNMWVTQLSADPDRYFMSIEFVVPTMTIYADRYSLATRRNILLLSVGVAFQGHFTCVFNNLKVHADVSFGRNGPNTVISSLRMQYTGYVQAYFSNTPYFVNVMANEKISQMMRDRRAIRNVENLIKERANVYLRGYTPKQFVEIISNI